MLSVCYLCLYNLFLYIIHDGVNHGDHDQREQRGAARAAEISSIRRREEAFRCTGCRRRCPSISDRGRPRPGRPGCGPGRGSPGRSSSSRWSAEPASYASWRVYARSPADACEAVETARMSQRSPCGMVISRALPFLFPVRRSNRRRTGRSRTCRSA